MVSTWGGFSRRSATEVNFGGTELKVIVSSFAQSGKVRVQVEYSGDRAAAPVVTSAQDFTFIALSITSFTPTSGRVGDIITITGTGFHPTARRNRVLFGERGRTYAFEVNSDGYRDQSTCAQKLPKLEK